MCPKFVSMHCKPNEFEKFQTFLLKFTQHDQLVIALNVHYTKISTHFQSIGFMNAITFFMDFIQKVFNLYIFLSAFRNS